jgi:hypothetical protein
VRGGSEDQYAHDRDHPAEHPPGRDPVQQRHQVRGEDVDDAVEGEDDEEQDERVVQDRRGVRRRAVDDEVEPVQGEHRVQERRGAVVDGGGDGDEAEQVEPTREPRPAHAAEAVRPVVDAARGRVLRSELGHRQPDEEDQEADHRPADRDRDRAAVVPRLSEGREAAAEDADDRERDREVGEPAPTAVELLLVAEGGEPLLVR